MNPAAKNSQPFSAYRYSGTAANLLWTMGWAIAAATAIVHSFGTRAQTDLTAAVIPSLAALLGGVVTLRSLPRANKLEPPDTSPPEPLARRITGWFATVAWGTVAILWNLSVFKVVTDEASDGNTGGILLLLPFSLIGWLLLIALCVMVTMAFDWVVEKIHGGPAKPPVILAAAHGQYSPKS